jgi:hypothetical protein
VKSIKVDNLNNWYKEVKKNGIILAEHQTNSDGNKDYWGFEDANEEAQYEYETLTNHGGIYCIDEKILYFIDVTFFPFTIHDICILEKGDVALIPILSYLYEFPINFNDLKNEVPNDLNSKLDNWDWLIQCLTDDNLKEDFGWYTYRVYGKTPDGINKEYYSKLINFITR